MTSAACTTAAFLDSTQSEQVLYSLGQCQTKLITMTGGNKDHVKHCSIVKFTASLFLSSETTLSDNLPAAHDDA